MEEDDLDILTALLAENETEEPRCQEAVDDLDDLFDNDDEDEEYTEGPEAEEESAAASALFGDVDDIEEEEEEVKDARNTTAKEQASDDLNKSKEDLEDELRRMQEKMQMLQQQLEASKKTPKSGPVRTLGSKLSPPTQARPKQTPSTQKIKAQAGKASSGPGRGETTILASSAPGREERSRFQESSDFSSELSNADLFKRKGQRTAHPARASTSAASSEERGPLVEIKIGSSFQPVESSSKVSSAVRSPPTSQKNRALAPPPARQPQSLPALPKDVAIEKYSGLRLRRPRVSSMEMDRKMGDRMLIRLSQLPERLAREKLEESDWVTFAVLVNKATPQSNSSVRPPQTN